MAYYTLSYSYTTQGFPSFYTYEPDWMVGMNNYFYSFSGGNLWRHNSASVDRCNFYGSAGISIIQSVFNQAPLENKIFKTLNLESDSAWGALCTTDLSSSQNITIDSTWFVKKEAAYFAFVRYTNTASVPPVIDYPKRSINGIGKTDIAITGAAPVSVVEFPSGVEVNSILSVGDEFYYSLTGTAYETLLQMGTVIAIDRTARQVTVDASCGACTIPALVPAVTDAFFVYVKSDVAESYGALGHYMIFTLTNASTSATELFAVESEVMKSNP